MQLAAPRICQPNHRGVYKLNCLCDIRVRRLIACTGSFRLHRGDRRGISLIELMVAIGITSIMLGLLLPAIGASRETARRITCQNNLKQIALATTLYMTEFQYFPPVFGTPNSTQLKNMSIIKDGKFHSVFTRLLPHIGESVLYNSMNFSVALEDFYISSGSKTGSRGVEANITSLSKQIGTFICPSDGDSFASGLGVCNYRANLGTERWWSSVDGPFMLNSKPAPISAVTDGLSNTAGFGEKLCGRLHSVRANPRIDMFEGGPGYPASIDEARDKCRYVKIDNYIYKVGLTWAVGTLSQTCYNHALEPNSEIVDCSVVPYGIVSGLVGLRSNHANGVNSVRLDGSVHFVSNSVNLSLWRAIGSRGGGELVPQE